MKTLDIQVIISGITLVVAVTTPFLANIVANIHDTKIKKLNLRFQKQSSYFQKQQNLFSAFISSASHYIESAYPSDKTDFVHLSNEILLYTPEYVWDDIQKLCDLIHSRESKKATAQLTVVTKLLGKVLEESNQQFPQL